MTRHAPWLLPALLTGALAAIALQAPNAALLLLALAPVALALALAYGFPVAATVLWLLIGGTMPDMWLGDWLGDQGPAIVAGMKLAGLLLVAGCALRWGWRADRFNPAWAFLIVFALGLTHAPPPGLDRGESLRSLLGSLAPFAFSFAVLPRSWVRGVGWATRLAPAVALALGLVFTAFGMLPLFDARFGLRLAGPGHPAFLAGFALAGVWASLLALFQPDGPRSAPFWLLVNVLILFLTGARAPLALGIAVCLIAFALIPSAALTGRARLGLLLGFAAAGVAVLGLAMADDGLRVFSLLRGEQGGLSGRDAIWPIFQQAWAASTWIGWGIGAGKVLVPVSSLLARLLGTNAAHNEYLRLGVEGGWIGLMLIAGSLALWVWSHTRHLPRAERILLRLIMASFAIHAYTDNVLIATTASGFFTWVSAAFAGGGNGSGRAGRHTE